jgi:lipopolysaccharide biosynthesis glycosyltransferase
LSNPVPDPIVIVCAADARYALPLAVTLRSVVDNLSPERRLDIYVIDDGIDPKNKQRLSDSLRFRADLHWIRPVRKGFSGLPIWGGMPMTTYDKLVIARLLPPAVRKAIWLDGDVLVLGDIAELWDGDISDCHVLAVQDAIVPLVSSRFGVAGFRELGIPPEAKYFNAGVMVINAIRWREEDIAGRAISYLKRYRDRVFFLDQEGLNAVLAGKWCEVNSRWNWNVMIDRIARAKLYPGGSPFTDPGPAGPRILHFAGNLKPWKYQGGLYHTLYFRFLDRTSWAGWRPRETFRGAALARYEASPLRRLLYPAEGWAMQVHRGLTRGYASIEDEKQP